MEILPCEVYNSTRNICVTADWSFSWGQCRCNHLLSSSLIITQSQFVNPWQFATLIVISLGHCGWQKWYVQRVTQTSRHLEAASHPRHWPAKVRRSTEGSRQLWSHRIPTAQPNSSATLVLFTSVPLCKKRGTMCEEKVSKDPKSTHPKRPGRVGFRTHTRYYRTIGRKKKKVLKEGPGAWVRAGILALCGWRGRRERSFK